MVNIRFVSAMSAVGGFGSDVQGRHFGRGSDVNGLGRLTAERGHRVRLYLHVPDHLGRFDVGDS